MKSDDEAMYELRVDRKITDKEQSSNVMKNNIDIDEKLNELIIRYKIDRFHPRFAKSIKAKQFMKEFFEEYKEKEMLFITACQTDIDYLREDCGFRNRGGGSFLF